MTLDEDERSVPLASAAGITVGAEMLMDRAAAAGFGVLVVTLDTQITGLRERDIGNGLSGRPFALHEEVLDGVGHGPSWPDRPGGYALAGGGQAGVSTILEMFRIDLDRTLRLLGCPSVTSLDRSYLTIPAWGR